MTAHVIPFPPRRGSAAEGGGRFAQDRAAIVATAVLQIVKQALVARLERDDVDLAAVRANVETLLREEFADVQRRAVADRDDFDIPF